MEWLCNSNQVYKITDVIYNGVSAGTEGGFTLLGEDVFNSEHSHDRIITKPEIGGPILNTKEFHEPSAETPHLWSGWKVAYTLPKHYIKEQ